MEPTTAFAAIRPLFAAARVIRADHEPWPIRLVDVSIVARSFTNSTGREVVDQRMEQADLDLTIVVPALNEEDNVRALVQQVEDTARKAKLNVELIVVDDGSDDKTLDILTGLEAGTVCLRLLHHDRPMGQSAAIRAGIHAARAPHVATLDADLQNDPADLVKMLDLVRRLEVDMVQGDRTANRQDSMARELSSWVGRTARRIILGDTIRDTGCSTRVVRTQIARQFPLQFRGTHRFLPIYARMLGARVVETPVQHRPRRAGLTKYGMLNRGPTGLIDCFAIRWMRNRLRSVNYREVPREDERLTVEIESPQAQEPEETTDAHRCTQIEAQAADRRGGTSSPTGAHGACK